MDITNSLAPRSDQINADDLVAGPQVFTIRGVTKGKAEQPFDFLLVETDRAFRPAVTMRRLIAAAWGTDGDQYVGRRIEVYRDPSIRFGKDVVGGIRISRMSHIDKRVEVKLQVTRGKRETFGVDPLPDAPAPIPARTDLNTLAAELKTNGITEPAEMLSACADIVGREIGGAAELSEAEVAQIVSTLRAARDEASES